HKLTEQLTARGSAQLQFGSFNGGLYDNQDEGFYILGLSLTYELNQYLALETGYNYDRLDSDDSQRSYSRNRVFLGVRGQF
ncbi:MAG: outer membrane beta-barrel protein, partial [Limisphaerales bacterium]